MTHDPIRAGVQAIWERAHAEILRHVSGLEEAAVVLAADSLTGTERRQSGLKARKLATMSGTFGFWDAAALARAAEVLLSGYAYILPVDAVRFTKIFGELRRQLGDPRLERRRE